MIVSVTVSSLRSGGTSPDSGATRLGYKESWLLHAVHVHSRCMHFIFSPIGSWLILTSLLGSSDCMRGIFGIMWRLLMYWNSSMRIYLSRHTDLYPLNKALPRFWFFLLIDNSRLFVRGGGGGGVVLVGLASVCNLVPEILDLVPSFGVGCPVSSWGFSVLI